MTTKELLENEIYPRLDVETLLSELEVRKNDGYYTLRCPECGKKEAYIPNKKTFKPIIICNRKNKCGYISSFWNYFKNYHSMSNRDILHHLAHNAGVPLTHYKTTNRTHSQKEKIFATIKQKPLMLEDIHPLPPTPFSHIATDIYRYCLQTDQTKKNTYYKKRGIENPPSDIGFLPQQTMQNLENFLQAKYPLQLLNQYNIFKADQFKYNFSSFCIIPSFDLFSNQLSAIRLRNINPTKIKEIEISNHRELNPFPYGVTLEKLYKYDSFYFTEGHIDALSLGVDNFVAVEGVNSFSPYNLGVFYNKTIILAFDQDKAGKQGVNRIAKFASKLNINLKQLIWDQNYGKDVNELLLNGNLQKISLIDLK